MSSRPTQGPPPADSLEVRARLADALELDLVGPWAGHPLSEERLRDWERPSKWYLTGFLIPSGTPPEESADTDEQDDLDEVGEVVGPAEESAEERKAAKKGFFPSSMGLSFLVFGETERLAATVRWGDYIKEQAVDGDGKAVSVWRRQPREETIDLPLTGALGPVAYDVPGSAGLQLYAVEGSISAEDLAEHIPQGTRSVSIFLVNRRQRVAHEVDAAYAFQPAIEIRGDRPFCPRPNLRGTRAEEWDERVADLHYADTPEYATGHGVSVGWEIVEGACRLLRTAWIPRAEVERTETAAVAGVELSMTVLGALADGPAMAAALAPLVAAYRAWIAVRRQALASLPSPRRDTAEGLLHHAAIAAGRIEKGIAILARGGDELDAFRIANRTMARALKQRRRNELPRWRAFQLAFLLLNLPGLADPADSHRATVDLLFFPTGGGKTEAYLGLAAFAMVLRRLRHPEDGGRAGAGVSVIMRYTLRLLTLDQLTRAAGLVCALELERVESSGRLGSWPFEIGLWVGQAATPNLLGSRGNDPPNSARSRVRAFKRDSRMNPSPVPLEACPWCGDRFTPDSFSLQPDADFPAELRIVCVNFTCAFSRDRALPIVAVDEAIYRRLPAFLIATLDKFASLPWVGESGALLGGSDRYDDAGFYGAAKPGQGNFLGRPLPGPDLVIQDELHLIAGPLGTMAGLYESAIEALCVRPHDDAAARPKIVASTATVRRAHDQIQALFARPLTQIFPPPGPDRRDSFFATTEPATRLPARLYLGIAAPGRNPKVLLRRAWLALMGAAEAAYRAAGGHQRQADNPADPYMTVLGYFNSLRELGGARRILEEEVQNTVKRYGDRRRFGEDVGLFRHRTTFSEVLELTSRVATTKVAAARQRLELGAYEEQRVDCAIATNMISVGLDIPRLGLMVVFGQPKTHAEYIQATSRVGRSAQKPGLVVTLLNIHKPRDRSHYERFRHYHETFYRSVEVASVTPFSARALDRGFAGALMALARHLLPALTPPLGVEQIGEVRAELERRLLAVFLARVRQQDMAEDERDERLRSVQNRVVEMLDAWRTIVRDNHAVGVDLQYQRHELSQPRPLLHDMLERTFDSDLHRKFRVQRSLRDVEPVVNLFLENLSGSRRGEGEP